MSGSTPLAKPLLLLVSGSSGAGKSSLASKLVESLGLFHVERDKIKFGVEFTLKSKPEERVNTVIPRYFAVLEGLLKLQVSCIADGTLFAGVSEAQHAGFADSATVLNIHCNASNAPERKQAWRRDLQRRVEEGDEQLIEYEPGYFPQLKALDDDPASKPLKHGFPILEVDTSDGYEPAFEEIMKWVQANAG